MSNLPIYPRWASSTVQLQNNQYISFGDNSNIGGFSSFTLEAWVCLSHTDIQNTVYVFDKSYYVDNQQQTEYSLYIDKGILKFKKDNHTFYSDFNPIKEYKWQYVAATFDKIKGILSLYCDGILLLEEFGISFTPKTLPADLWTGATRNSSNQPINSFYKGLIRSVMVWNICRSGAEIMSDSMNTGTDFFHISDLTSTDPSTNPDYVCTRVSPVLAVDFATLPPIDISGVPNSISLMNGALYIFYIPSTSFDGHNTNQAKYISANTKAYHIYRETSFTIDGWFLSTQNTDKQTIISCGNGEQEYIVKLASMNDGNVLIASRGSDSLSSNKKLKLNTYYHFALSYNYIEDTPEKSTLSLFVNGNLCSLIFANSEINTQIGVDLVIGAANNSVGRTGDYFYGNIQNINFWNISHDEAQVRQWMYNQAIDDDALISAFDLSVYPAVDTANQVPLNFYAHFTEQQLPVSPDDIIWDAPMPINATYLSQKKVEITGNEQTIITEMKVQPEIFSEEHKQAIYKGVKKWIGPVMSTESFKLKFDIAFEQAKQIMDKDPRLKKVITRIDQNGITKLIYHGRHKDHLILSTTTGLLSDCTLWWIGFVTHLTVGFLEALGLFPSVEGTAEKVYLKIVGNNAARTALVDLTKGTITVDNSIGFFGVLNSQKILWTIVKILLAALGWWALAKVIAIIIGIVTGLEVAALLAGFIIWAAQLILLTLNYNGSCGSSGPPPTKIK
ncbi:hypothetical protein IRZ71_22065 [Flavobacterium sp. ANB]|uniref:LamG-like jellyroll fold domain-containing protein n=1 Tax=unclassified Flavobacterium TaxID=196869 RepID=UPI0012B70175|nr:MULTISPECIES: LamG-like jellyroll fold domain-containing protein [unclassified Flavobacterium]MBF4519048.1 hypothetical protein [Flavobacterium sp. ANB]MTD71752.1 hypothetical protein [Flavobacterium sp. LC2016-13]